MNDVTMCVCVCLNKTETHTHTHMLLLPPCKTNHRMKRFISSSVLFPALIGSELRSFRSVRDPVGGGSLITGQHRLIQRVLQNLTETFLYFWESSRTGTRGPADPDPDSRWFHSWFVSGVRCSSDTFQTFSIQTETLAPPQLTARRLQTNQSQV